MIHFPIKYCLLCIVLFVEFDALFGQEKEIVDSVLSFESDLLEVEEEIDFDRLDSLTQMLFMKEHWWVEDSIANHFIYLSKDQVPYYEDSTVQAMMALIPANIPLQLNDVTKKYIDYFATRRRLFVAKALGLSEQYFPLYEEVFDKYGLPDELKYLSVIESGLNPKARSWVGATGLWQFMFRTGKMYGLNVNSYIDERSDPILATDAAAQFLSYLFDMYDDWQLALAAYNAGPGNVNKALARSGKKTFWGIRPYLPKETQNYVPQYIACVFTMYYHELYDIYPLKPKQEVVAYDTILVKEKVSLNHMAQVLGVDKEHLSFLNPSLKLDIIPKTEEGFSLKIPVDQLTAFVLHEATILNDTTLDVVEEEVVELPEYVVYKVKSGDTLGHIAQKYNVKISSIKQWNGLKSDFLSIGQKLVLYI